MPFMSPLVRLRKTRACLLFRFAKWLSVGDFDVNLKASVGKINACYDIKFALKPKK